MKPALLFRCEEDDAGYPKRGSAPFVDLAGGEERGKTPLVSVLFVRGDPRGDEPRELVFSRGDPRGDLFLPVRS